MEVQKYIDDMRDLFLTPGWQWLVADCEQAIQASDDVDRITNERELYDAKGAKRFANQILRLPEFIEQLEAQEEEDEKDS